LSKPHFPRDAGHNVKETWLHLSLKNPTASTGNYLLFVLSGFCVGKVYHLCVCECMGYKCSCKFKISYPFKWKPEYKTRQNFCLCFPASHKETNFFQLLCKVLDL